MAPLGSGQPFQDRLYVTGQYCPGRDRETVKSDVLCLLRRSYNSITNSASACLIISRLHTFLGASEVPSFHSFAYIALHSESVSERTAMA
jgi:hypothetical protein